jgi:FlaG/FlaF family flagellin (archaellin)
VFPPVPRPRSPRRIDRPRFDRAFAPIAAVCLLLLVVVLGGGFAAIVTSAADPIDPAPTASLSVTVEGSTVTLSHEGGDPIDVSDVRISVRVDGEALSEQPPVPFFSASGFEPGPTGAFNSAGTTTLSAGDRASFSIAGTNDPVPTPGATVEVRIDAGSTPVVRLSTTAREA